MIARGGNQNTKGAVQQVLCGLLMLLVLGSPGSSATAELRVRWRSGGGPRTAKPAKQTARLIENLTPQLGQRHIVVQFGGPIGPAERARLESGGVQLLNSVGDNAYFACLSSSKKIFPRTLEGVRSLADAMPVEANWKLHPHLAAGRTPMWAAVDNNAAGEVVFGAYVLFHPDVPLVPDGLNAIVRHGGTVRSELPSINGLVVELTQSQITALSREDIVEYAEPALPQLSPLNNDNRRQTGADIAQAAPFNLDGSGITVLLYDAGRAGGTGGGNFGQIHPDYSSRLTFGDTAPFSAHAAHVAGTIGGDGSSSVAGLYRGMAPGVTMLSYGFESDGTNVFLYSNPGDLQTDYTDAIMLGADISNNSIGTNTCSNGFPCAITGDYGVTSALIDAIVAGSLGSPFRVIWANGNERTCTTCPLVDRPASGYHSTAPPSGAKNHVSVGAINSNDDTMTTFSSWGPTDDGRLKPDIVAPGCQSTDDLAVTSTNTGLGLFGYSLMCGTSMATPTVTGLSALLLQDYRVQFPGQPDFRNSTLKILLAQNAVDLGNTGPDYQNGYGSVRIEPTINSMRTGGFLENQVAQGQTFSIPITVQAGDTELKVTLAWDDAPGTPNVDPALVNDLDLQVFSPSSVRHYPWILDPANPELPATACVGGGCTMADEDHINNIEQVVVNNPEVGVWTIEVMGTNVPTGPQSFSLVGSPPIEVDPVLALTPSNTNVPAGTMHTVTASAHQGFRRDPAMPFAPITNTLVTFNVISGPNVGMTGTATTDANGLATFTYTGANVVGTDQIQASFDDAGTTRFSNTATANWVAGSITLSPTTATPSECMGHTLTATVMQGAAPALPIVGATVTFNVLSGPNASLSGTAVTDASGIASFNYPGTGGTGTDQIQASFVDVAMTQLSNTVDAIWQASTTGNDCNFNGIPDECEVGGVLDCNANGIPDLCDLSPNLTFGTFVSNAVDANPSDVISANLNADAFPDLVTSSNTNSTVTVKINNGDGTFAAGVDYSIDGSSPGIAAADMDGDGDIDLAAVTNRDTVSVLMNNGNGTYAAEIVYNTLGNTPSSIAAGDLDGINGPDLVITNIKDDGVHFFVSVMLNSGTGTFPTSVPYIVSANAAFGDRPEEVMIADLDGINGPDLAVANKQSNSISILLNNGDGTFPASPPIIFVGTQPNSLTAGDWDGDGDQDLAVANSGNDTVTILINNNNSGSFPTRSTLTVGTPVIIDAPDSILADDLDGDGDLDLAVANIGRLPPANIPGTTVSIFINHGDGNFTPLTTDPTVADFPTSITSGDFDQDGDSDLATAHVDTTAGPGTGVVSVLDNAVSQLSLDCNSDGIPDECQGPSANAGADVTACIQTTTSVTVGGSPTSCGGQAPFSYAWTGTGAVFLNNTTIANPIFDVTAAAVAGGGTFQVCVEVTDSSTPTPLVGTDCAKIDLASDQLMVTVELAPTINTGIMALPTLTRCIDFELFDCNGSSITITSEITFNVQSGMPTTGSDVITLPTCTRYTCITARDRFHTTRRTDNDDFGMTPIIGTQYVADFSDQTGSGGDNDSLIGGDLNTDGLIDILDFAIFVNRVNGTGFADGNTTCATASPHADISGNGVVGVEDFTFIMINFLSETAKSEPNCCGNPGLSLGSITQAPLREITLEELKRRGLDELAAADLDHNGILDQFDIAALLLNPPPGHLNIRPLSSTGLMESKR